MTRFSLAGALVLLLASSSSWAACDWKVYKTKNLMTDAVTCWVKSPSAKVSFFRRGSVRPNVMNVSAYSDSGLMLRVDDNKDIVMGENAYTRQKALDELLPQIKSGKRLRTTFDDYPHRQDGDAQLCNLAQLLDAC